MNQKRVPELNIDELSCAPQINCQFCMDCNVGKWGDNIQDGEKFFEDAGDDDLDYNAVGQLHFGGGFTRKDNGHLEDAPERVKSKKEVIFCSILRKYTTP